MSASQTSNVSAAYEMLSAYARERPTETVIVLAALVVSSVIESFGVVSLLPLLSLAQGDKPAPGSAGDQVMQAVAWLGVTPSLLGFMTFVAAATLAKSAIRMAADLYLARSVAGLVRGMRLRLLRAIGDAKWDFLIDQSSGQIATLFNSESIRAANGMNQSVQIASALIQACLALAAAFFISWQFTLATVAAYIVIAIPLQRLIRLSRQSGRILTTSMNALIHNVVEGLQGFKALKAMARERTLVLVLESDIERYRRASLQNSAASIALTHLPEVATVSVFCVAVYWFLSAGNVPLNEIAVIAALGYRGANRMTDLQRQLQKAVAMHQGFLVMRTMTTDAEVAREASTTHGQRPNFEREIVVRSVDFSFGEKDVLKAVNLTIPARGITALIGPSGAGKSTFIDLLLGLRKPTRGDISIDGVSIGDLNLRQWRGLIGYVPQETHLFNKSIYENVALGDHSISREAVDRALSKAGAADWVKSLPSGIDTVAGSAGLRFSGGQRQRISLARALVHEPKLLLLDEATSALDPETEALICATLKTLGRSTAILAVSHQPGLLFIADKVYRIQGGRIHTVEPGIAANASH